MLSEYVNKKKRFLLHFTRGDNSHKGAGLDPERYFHFFKANKKDTAMESVIVAESTSPHRWIFKVILMGDYAVGKTCIIRRYVSNTFIEDYKPSLGVDITSQELSFDQDEVQLQIWDMSGQTDFKLVRRQFMSGTDCGIMVFDLTRPDSLNNIERWINEVLVMVPNLPLVLVGNKADLTSDRRVSTDAANRTMKNHFGGCKIGFRKWGE